MSSLLYCGLVEVTFFCKSELCLCLSMCPVHSISQNINGNLSVVTTSFSISHAVYSNVIDLYSFTPVGYCGQATCSWRSNISKSVRPSLTCFGSPHLFCQRPYYRINYHLVHSTTAYLLTSVIALPNN